MKQRPFYYVFLTFFLLLIVVSFPLHIMYLFNYGFKDFYKTFDHLNLMNWLTMGTCFVSVYYAWVVNPKLNYIVGFLTLLVIISALPFSSKVTDFSLFKTSIANFLFLIPLSFLLVPEYQEALKNKSKHWWKTPPRVQTEVQVQLELVAPDSNQKVNFSAKTINISKTGALLLIKPEALTELQLLLKVHSNHSQHLKLKLDNQEFKNCFEAELELIRFNRIKESDAFSLAVHFRNVSYLNKLRLYTQVLHS